MVLDCVAIGDVDYTAAAVLTRVIEHLRKRHIRFVVSSVLGPVREQLDRYGISAALGPGAYYDTPGEALEAFHATKRAIVELTAHASSSSIAMTTPALERSPRMPASHRQPGQPDSPILCWMVVLAIRRPMAMRYPLSTAPGSPARRLLPSRPASPR